MASSLSDFELEDIDEMIGSLEQLKESNDGLEELQRMIHSRAESLDSNAQAGLAEFALKKGNLGWLDEMEVARTRGGQYAWVKKTNVAKWQAL